MKTASIKTLASFIDASHLDGALIRAVVRQLGGWESFTQSAPDIGSALYAGKDIDGGLNMLNAPACGPCGAIVTVTPAKNKAAVALGKMGGKASAARMTEAERKARASKAGRAGGWPLGKPRKVLTPPPG